MAAVEEEAASVLEKVEALRAELVAAGEEDTPVNIMRMAAKQKQWDVVQHMVEEEGADVNAPDTMMGQTALHIVVRVGSEEGVRLLVGRLHADVHCRDFLGTPPYSLAASEGKTECLRAFFEEGALDASSRDLLQDLLEEAACGGQLETFQYLEELLKNAADGGSPSYGQFVFAAAIVRGPTLLRYLVEEHGADVNAVNEDGRSALHLAARDANLEIVKFLVEEADADVLVEDCNGRRPSYYLPVGEDYNDIRELLREAEEMAQMQKQA